MSFWCHRLDQNEKIWQISTLAQYLKSGQIKKIKALSYINYGLFNVIKCLYFFWFDHSLGAMAEICQIFSLVKNLFWNYLTFSERHLEK